MIREVVLCPKRHLSRIDIRVAGKQDIIPQGSVYNITFGKPVINLNEAINLLFDNVKLDYSLIEHINFK
jgi:hypothetical protein